MREPENTLFDMKMTHGQVRRMKNRPRKVQSNRNSENVKQEDKNTVGLHLYLSLHDVLLWFNWPKDIKNTEFTIKKNPNK